MTPQEINEAVARKLGHEWPVIDPGHHPACPFRKKDYCRSIEAAWEIVEHQGDFGLAQGTKGWTASFGYGNEEAVFGIADTAPMAICRAFLKVP